MFAAERRKQASEMQVAIAANRFFEGTEWRVRLAKQKNSL
jgi:hypothetical protein